MKALITTTAPTNYQYNSMRSFNLDVQNKCPYSSEIQAYTLFDNVKDARKYLKERAEIYYESDKKSIKWNMGKDSLDIDACTGRILTGEEYIRFMESDNRKY
jgi:hypothetical protein